MTQVGTTMMAERRSAKITSRALMGSSDRISALFHVAKRWASEWRIIV